MHKAHVGGEAAEKTDAQTPRICLSCGRALTQSGPAGECLRCLVSLAFLPDGEPLGPGRTLEEIRARQSEEPPLDQLKDAEISLPVIGLLKSMLAIDPAARPQSARELLAAVHRCSKMEQESPAVFEAAARREEGFWVAVLPFKFSGIDSEIAVLSEGLNEEIVTGLSRFPYLRVIARSSTLRLSLKRSTYAGPATNWARATSWKEACARRETSCG
jgi:hypothetical protein